MLRHGQQDQECGHRVQVRDGFHPSSGFHPFYGNPFRRRPSFRRPPWMNILNDILALLPIPQIMILVLFANMKSTMYLENRWRMMLPPLFQYVPRVIRIYLLCKELSKSSTPNDITGTAWVRGTFNFFIFILASHVVGAFWYCFSVERELHCWQRACKYNSGCRANTFFCDDITGNERFVDQLCPINPPDPVIFDFGIFLDAHQSGVSRVMDFPVKLLYCFFWGLRALSSFGSNLTTSIYSCENMFAAFVSIAGILLVVYLIGNLQVYLQSSTSRSEEKRRMMQNKEDETNLWIDDCGLQDKKKEIMQFVRDKFDGNSDVNLTTLLRVFPPAMADSIKEMLWLPFRENVLSPQNLGQIELNEMLEHLKPVVFAEQSYIVREGEPIEQMLLFTRGIAWAYSSRREEGEDGTESVSIASACSSRRDEGEDGTESVHVPEILGRGNCFGEQLLTWVVTGRASKFPLSQRTLKAHTQMEAFALRAVDLAPLAAWLR